MNPSKPIKILFLFFSLLILSSSCESKKNYELEWNDAQADYSNKDFNSCLVNLNIILSDDNYTGDLKPRALFLVSEVYLNEFKENDISITFLNKIINHYPDHEMAKRALFTKAYINANYIESFTEAVELYNQFLTLYPNDDLILSVQYELDELKKYESKISDLIKK